MFLYVSICLHVFIFNTITFSLKYWSGTTYIGGPIELKDGGGWRFLVASPFYELNFFCNDFCVQLKINVIYESTIMFFPIKS